MPFNIIPRNNFGKANKTRDNGITSAFGQLLSRIQLELLQHDESQNSEAEDLSS
jgi:hypothetical protein